MNFFNCLTNDWADITDLSSAGSEFHKQFPLNLMDLCPRELCMFKMKMLSDAGIVCVHHIILAKII